MNRMPGFLILIGLLLLVAYTSIYRVMETERAVKLRFGRMVEPDVQPGLHIKYPFADEVRKFDARVLTLDADEEIFFTKDEERLRVDSYVKWKISDVETYYKATNGQETVAKARLEARVNDGLRNQVGDRTLQEVVSGQRDQLMTQLTESLNESVQAALGVEVIDVRVKRIDFPEEVSERVYKRMRADREKEARQSRSEGKEQAEEIRANADRQKVVIEANAYRESELLRGEGDASAAATYAAAFTKDPEFYAFMRSLNAYKQSFANKGDIMLVDPDSDFFRYLKDPKGGER